MPESSDFLFTYGTLMHGFDNPFAKRLRKDAIFEGTGYFPGILYQIGWYPGAVFVESSPFKVYGEIYKLPQAQALWTDLDAYEDVFEDPKASLYLRRIVPVISKDHLVINCWAYLYNQPVEKLDVIKDGIFRNFPQ